MKKHHDIFPTRVYEYQLDDDDMGMVDEALEFIKTCLLYTSDAADE